MNREILFRGLKADGSNEWVYGYCRKWFNSYDGNEVHIISNDYGEGSLVIHSTVGQFCGLTDKNGTRIFEGDYDINGIMVTWCNNCNGWEFAQIDIPTKDICIPCHRCDGNFFFEDHINDFEVIGNIHQK